MVELSILLLTKNGAHDLELLLPAIYAQIDIPSFEVIAVDSGSTDGSLGVMRQFSMQIEEISPASFHHACTRNYAATLAKGKILVFLSQDAIPASERWLSNLIVNFNDPRVGAVYGRQFPKEGSSIEREDLLNAVYGETKVVKDPSSCNRIGYRFYHFSDVNAAIRRNVWEAVRFPEDLKVFEDLGIAKRILDAGWKIVYEPTASVYHSHSHSTLGLFKRYFDIGYTLNRLKIWEAPGTKGSMVQDGWNLVKNKLKRSKHVSNPQVAGEGIQQEIAKSIGFFLGVNQSFLPLVLKRRMSAFGVFE